MPILNKPVLTRVVSLCLGGCLIISCLVGAKAHGDDSGDFSDTIFDADVSGGDVTIVTWTTPGDTVVDQSGQVVDQSAPQQGQEADVRSLPVRLVFDNSYCPALLAGPGGDDLGAGVKCGSFKIVRFDPVEQTPVVEPVVQDDYLVVSQAAQQALLQVQLPDPVIEFDPDPSVNKWGVWAVNLPIWLVTDTSPAHHQVSQNGMDIAMDAVPVVTFDMGDGETVTCHTSRKRISWVDKDPWKPSPVCGYAYPKPDTYTITATTTWTITWAAAGHTGTLTTTTTNTRNITISEFHTILVK